MIDISIKGSYINVLICIFSGVIKLILSKRRVILYSSLGNCSLYSAINLQVWFDEKLFKFYSKIILWQRYASWLRAYRPCIHSQWSVSWSSRAMRKCARQSIFLAWGQICPSVCQTWVRHPGRNAAVSWPCSWQSRPCNLRPPESVSAQGICISWIRTPLPPPTLSWTLAGWTLTDMGSPRVSTTMCSFLPFIFLLPSIPLWPSIWWEVLTLLESMIPRLGLSALPERRRTMPRRVSKISSSRPSFFHLLK